MRHLWSGIASVALIAAGASAQVVDEGSVTKAATTTALDVQRAALDTAIRYWTAEGRLKGRVLVIDPRPALPSLDGRRIAPREVQSRPTARAAAITRQMAAWIAARPATDAELHPCAPGRRCTFVANLATIIFGDPIVTGDSAAVTIGVSVVYEARGRLRPTATYQRVSLVRTAGRWRPVSLRLAGQG